MSFFRRRGEMASSNGASPMLQLPSGEQNGTSDGWGSAETEEPWRVKQASGVWVVLKLNKRIPEGEWTAEPRRSVLRGGFGGKIMEADSGLDAIMAYYRDEYDKLEDTEREKADGRYVALDFYGGERVEALLTGDWKVQVDVAPPRIGT